MLHVVGKFGYFVTRNLEGCRATYDFKLSDNESARLVAFPLKIEYLEANIQEEYLDCSCIWTKHFPVNFPFELISSALFFQKDTFFYPSR